MPSTTDKSNPTKISLFGRCLTCCGITTSVAGDESDNEPYEALLPEATVKTSHYGTGTLDFITKTSADSDAAAPHGPLGATTPASPNLAGKKRKHSSSRQPSNENNLEIDEGYMRSLCESFFEIHNEHINACFRKIEEEKNEKDWKKARKQAKSQTEKKVTGATGKFIAAYKQFKVSGGDTQLESSINYALKTINNVLSHPPTYLKLDLQICFKDWNKFLVINLHYLDDQYLNDYGYKKNRTTLGKSVKNNILECLKALRAKFEELTREKPSDYASLHQSELHRLTKKLTRFKTIIENIAKDNLNYNNMVANKTSYPREEALLDLANKIHFHLKYAIQNSNYFDPVYSTSDEYYLGQYIIAAMTLLMKTSEQIKTIYNKIKKDINDINDDNSFLSQQCYDDKEDNPLVKVLELIISKLSEMKEELGKKKSDEKLGTQPMQPSR